MQEDWDKDKFPTSAKPVFKGLGLLLLIIIGFCGLVYMFSEHPVDNQAQEKHEQVANDFSPDDIDAEEETALPAVEQ